MTQARSHRAVVVTRRIGVGLCALVLLAPSFLGAQKAPDRAIDKGTDIGVRDANASFLDVVARRAELKAAKTPRLVEAIANLKSCSPATFPEPPPRGEKIPPKYKSGSHDVNPLEQELSQPYRRMQDVAARAANRYVATGDPAEANCVIQALLPWAKSRALLAYDKRDEAGTWFQSTRTVASLALSVSVVRGEPGLKASERDLVVAWLKDAAYEAVNEDRGAHHGPYRNAAFFWRGLAAAAAGVINNDKSLLDMGLRVYATAIHEMDAQGAFPAEMGAHEMALADQAFAIAPLVMIAELARRQGLNIYNLAEDGHHLQDAVMFLDRAMADPSLMKKYTSEPQQLGGDLAPGGSLLAWTEFWNARPGAPPPKFSIEKPMYDARISGSSTLYASPVDEAETKASVQQNPR